MRCHSPRCPAGAPTSIVEIQTCGNFMMEAFTLLGREVQAVEDALTRDAEDDTGP